MFFNGLKTMYQLLVHRHFRPRIASQKLTSPSTPNVKLSPLHKQQTPVHTDRQEVTIELIHTSTIPARSPPSPSHDQYVFHNISTPLLRNPLHSNTPLSPHPPSLQHNSLQRSLLYRFLPRHLQRRRQLRPDPQPSRSQNLTAFSWCVWHALGREWDYVRAVSDWRNGYGRGSDDKLG